MQAMYAEDGVFLTPSVRKTRRSSAPNSFRTLQRRSSWQSHPPPRLPDFNASAISGERTTRSSGGRHDAGRGVAMTEHAVVIAGGGPTGLMLAGELALAGVDVAIVERRASQELAGSRAGGLHSRTIEVLDQRGIADRFLSEGQVVQVAAFAGIPLDISDFPTRHNLRARRCGRTTSSAYWPAGSTSLRCRSIANAK